MQQVRLQALRVPAHQQCSQQAQYACAVLEMYRLRAPAGAYVRLRALRESYVAGLGG
jgi:hypothetical protein